MQVRVDNWQQAFDDYPATHNAAFNQHVTASDCRLATSGSSTKQEMEGHILLGSEPGPTPNRVSCLTLHNMQAVLQHSRSYECSSSVRLYLLQQLLRSKDLQYAML